MPLSFSTYSHSAVIILSDYTGKTVSVRYNNLTATTQAQAIIDAQEIANRLKAISAHQVKTLGVNTIFTDVDSDDPHGSIDKETVGYVVGQTLTDKEAVIEIPGYSGPQTNGDIDLLNTAVQDYLIMFEDTAFVFGQELIFDFERGWVLSRNTVPS